MRPASFQALPPMPNLNSSYLKRHGMTELSGDALCCACQGMALLITVTRGDRRLLVLFDSGPEEYALERNAGRRGADLVLCIARTSAKVETTYSFKHSSRRFEMVDACG